MLINYLKVGIRNLLKHKWYTLIHVMGLALGLAAFLLIDRYTGFERSYDNFHHQPDQLYRLTTDNIVNGQMQVRDAMSFAPSGKALMDDLPEVLSYTTTLKLSSVVFRQGAVVVEETGVLAVDSSFLQLFNYPLVNGIAAASDLLAEPYTIVLSKSMAEKYFPRQDPVGRNLEILGNINNTFTVTGVLEDIPGNTHYHFDMLMSIASVRDRLENDGWSGYNYYTYLQLDKQSDLPALRDKLPALTKKYLGEQTTLVFNLQPVQDIHLYSDFTFEPEVHGSSKAVGFLSIISLFILVIAWVNYTNLSTARAIDRAKEVGLRKVVGAQRKQLIGQFMTESLMINFSGAVVALVLSQLILPYFNNLVGQNILTRVWQHPDFLQKLGLFFLLGTLLAGAYPAFVLASFQPIGVLKGSFGRSKKGVYLRKALVVMQFSASLILIAGTLIIFQQLRYMTNVDMGMNIDQVISVQSPRIRSEQRAEYRGKYEAFKDELKRVQGIRGLATMADPPGGGSSDISSNSGGIRIAGKTERLESTVYINTIDDQVLELLEIDLLAGRNFDREVAGDSGVVLVNQAFLQLFSIADPMSVLNEKVQFGRNENNTLYPIVGVAEDFNRTTLKNRVEPTIFFYRPADSYTLIKLNGEQLTSSLSELENLWQKFFPQTPLSYNFLDQRFEKLYREEVRFGQLFANFSVLAIIVAALGLLGLAAFLSSQRTKEVGVRKVLGASVVSIVILFFREYLWLIALAVLVGLPLIFTGMNQWLNNYAYRIDFPWLSLVVATLILIGFAFLTVGYQTYRVAILDPSRTIRHE